MAVGAAAGKGDDVAVAVRQLGTGVEIPGVLRQDFQRIRGGSVRGNGIVGRRAEIRVIFQGLVAAIDMQAEAGARAHTDAHGGID